MTNCVLFSMYSFCIFTFHTISSINMADIRVLQGESLARGPKLLSIKNYVIEIMTWKFIYTYREQCKTGPAHNRCWNCSPFTSKHTGMRFSKFWNTFHEVSRLTIWISWRIASLSCSIVRGVFLYTLPFSRPQSKKSLGFRSASPCLLLFNQFLDATLRWWTSFTKFRSKCRLACFKWTCLSVFTNENLALFDCINWQ